MPRPPLDAESLRRLGGLAQLAIPDSAAASLAADLSQILAYVEEFLPSGAAVGAELRSGDGRPAAPGTPRQPDRVTAPVLATGAPFRPDSATAADGAPLLAASAGHEGRFVRVPAG